MAFASVMVYSFEVLDPEAKMRHMPFKTTREAIASQEGAKLIDGTGEEVAVSALDPHGRYYRHSRGWTLEQLQAIC
jgi:hypothetical protein